MICRTNEYEDSSNMVLEEEYGVGCMVMVVETSHTMVVDTTMDWAPVTKPYSHHKTNDNVAR